MEGSSHVNLSVDGLRSRWWQPDRRWRCCSSTALLAGSHGIDTDGQFIQTDVSFENQRWYTVEPDSLGVKGLATKVDLSRVDEVGFVDLAPAGGHGSSGWANISWIEVYAKAVPRRAGG